MTAIKICGLTNIKDAVDSVNLGADFIGFVFAESPRRASINVVKDICREVGTQVKTVGVFTEESDEIIKIIDNCNLNYAQLHGNQSESFAQKIGSERIIRVLRIKDKESLSLLSDYKEYKYLLLDTYKKGQPGGTGETFNWNQAVQAIKKTDKPLILSGGLLPANIADAIKTVKPFAVDISSGVEKYPGKKDYSKIKELIENVRKTDFAS